MSDEHQPQRFTYDAFATYATDPDRDLVRNVEDFIESLHRDRLIPKKFRTKLALCVDGQDFRIPKAGSTSQQTLEELMHKVVRAYQASSGCLLVFSGSNTISHCWINVEIDWWREQANSGPIYFVLTHGQLEEDAQKQILIDKLLPNALAHNRVGMSPIWFDLRGYYSKPNWGFRRSAVDRKIRAEFFDWAKVRDYDEERFRLAAHILSHRVDQPLSKEDLIPKWQAAWRLKRRIRRVMLAFAIAILAPIAVAIDRTLEGQQIEALTTAAQTAIDDQEYERAIKVAIHGLPVDGDFFWRHGWSDTRVRKLLAVLAGASQLSAYVGQLKTDEAASIQNAEFDPSGTKIVTASQAGTVTVWESSSRKKLSACKQDEAFAGYQPSQSEGTTQWVRDSRFGQSADTVLSAGRYGAWIWSPKDVLNCQPKARMVGHRADVRTGAFSPDWKKVVTTSDDETVIEWDAASGNKIGELELPGSDLPKGYRYTTSAEFSPDGQSIVVGRRDGLIAIVNAESRKVAHVLRESGAVVWSVRFDRSGQRVISSSGNGDVVIWDVLARRPASFFRQPSGVGKSQLSPDQRFVVTTSLDRTARIWDITTLGQVFALKGHKRSVLSASFSPNGKQIVTSSDDQTARIWSIGTNIFPSVVTATSYPIESSAISSDGRKFVIGTFDGRVIAYDIVAGSELRNSAELRPDAGAITSVAFDANAAAVVVATNRGGVFFWRKDSKNIQPIADLPQAKSFAASSPDGTLITTASSLDAKQYRGEVLNVQTGTSYPLEGASLVSGIEFDSTGNRIAAASEVTIDGQQLALVWDTKTGKKIWELKHSAKVLSAHFSRDGSYLATSTIDRNAYVWDLSSGRQVGVFSGHTYDVHSARLSFDGKRLATASSDRTVRIWDRETAVPMLQFAVGRQANDAFFSGDGNNVIVTTAGGDILVYDVSWTAKLDRALKVRACNEKLSDIDVDGECSRTGPFSREFWRRRIF
jgi:WD40 repeat protein